MDRLSGNDSGNASNRAKAKFRASHKAQIKAAIDELATYHAAYFHVPEQTVHANAVKAISAVLDGAFDKDDA